MGKKSRKKKNADFKKVKIRVGRKLPKQNDVDLSFATKKISIRENVTQSEKPGTQQVYRLSTIIPRLHSRHHEELTSALGDLRLWIKQHPDDAKQLLLMEMQKCVVPLVRHLDSKVRAAAGQVFTALLHIVGTTPAYFPSLAQCMFSALVHIDVGVRAAGWEYLRHMVDAAPKLLPALNCERLLAELSRRVPQETVSLSSAKAGRAIHLVERLLVTLSPTPPLEFANPTVSVETVDDISNPFRRCIFEWDPRALDSIWLNGHLARAAEQGLGWQGQPNYTVADFLSDLAPWFLSHMKEFHNIEDPVSQLEPSTSAADLGDRLQSLLVILKVALAHDVYRSPLKPEAADLFSDCARVTWGLFPIASDATIFHRRDKAKRSGTAATENVVLSTNMTLIHIRCLHLAASDVQSSETDTKFLGEFFNEVMPGMWPPQRSVCLQWIGFADVCLHGNVGSRNSSWLTLLLSIVERIRDCNEEEGSKVGNLCRNLVHVYQKRNFCPQPS